MNPIISNPSCARGRGLRAALGRIVLKAVGWRCEIHDHLPKQCVLIVYPHTSNWDFPLGLCAKWASGLEVNYLGKDSLFRGPFGWFFRATGGVPVDRRHPQGMVGATVAQIAQCRAAGKTLRIAIAPEGTRKFVPVLKTGFYWIAKAAQVPLVLCTIDYARKRIAFLDVIEAIGDEAVDLERMQSVFRGVEGKNVADMGAIAFGETR